MTFFLTILKFSGYYEAPQGLLGWSLWLALLIAIIWLLLRWREYHPKWTDRSMRILVVFLILVPITGVFFGIHLPSGELAAFSGNASVPAGALILLLSAIPWVIAAGLLGPIPAASLAALSGGLNAFFDSHNPFIPLIYALIAAIMSVLMQQNYRTFFYRTISHPLAAAFLVSLIYPFLFLFSNLFVANGGVGARLDFGISHVGLAALAFSVQLFLAAAVGEIIVLIWTNFWEQGKTHQPSPAESSLQVRLVFTLAPLVVVIMIAILIGQWISMVNTNQELLGGRLGNVAQSASNSIPVAMETGQNLINQLARDPRMLADEDSEVLSLVLVEYFNQVPFLISLFTWMPIGI